MTDPYGLPDDAVTILSPGGSAPTTTAPGGTTPDYPAYGLPADAVPLYTPPMSVEPRPDQTGFGYTTGVFAGFNPPVTDTQKYLANARTGLLKAYGVAGGLPNSIGRLSDYIANRIGAQEGPGMLTQIWPSPDEIMSKIQKADAVVNPYFGLPASQPLYQPEGTSGRIGQEILSGAPLAAIGGIPALLGREAANVGGVLGSEGMKQLAPDDPWAQMLAGIISSVAGSKAPQVGGQILHNTATAEQQAAANMTRAANMTAPEMLAATVPSPTRNATGQFVGGPRTQIPALPDYSGAAGMGGGAIPNRIGQPIPDAYRGALGLGAGTYVLQNYDQILAHPFLHGTAIPAMIARQRLHSYGDQVNGIVQDALTNETAARRLLSQYRPGGLLDYIGNNAMGVVAPMTNR